jgi:hypothetical protein
MPYFADNSYHQAPEIIDDVKDALAAMTLMFDDTIDMGAAHKRGVTIILNCLREVLNVAGVKAEQDHKISHAQQKTEDDMKRLIEAARAEAYAKGREEGAKTIKESIDRIERVVQPIIDRAAAVSENDGVYPHIGTPAPDIGATSARCA